MNKAQIVEIYQRYLDHRDMAGNAETKICEFLDKDSLDEVDLNADNDQRVMLIAGNFSQGSNRNCTLVAWPRGSSPVFPCCPVLFRGRNFR